MSSYSISPKLKSNRVFILQKSELEKRFDPSWYVYLATIRSFKHKLLPLKNFLIDNPQYGANEIGVERIDNTKPRYIRITDINDYGELENGLGKTANKIEEKYFLKENDLLLARSGNTVGKSYLHKDVGYDCFFAGYMIRFKLDASKILPEYVFAYTQTNFYKNWTKAIQRTTGQPNINAEEYRSLEIPLPDFDTQKKVVQMYFDVLSKKQKNEAAAEKLLSSIDDYLLKELGITLLTPPENMLKNRMFKVNMTEISGDRFDPLWFLYLQNISKSKYPEIRLKKLLLENPQYGANEIGIERLSLSQPRYIRITDINAIGDLSNELGKTSNVIEEKYYLNNDDVLIARSGNTVGKSYLHKETGYKCFFAGYMIRFKIDLLKVLPEYLFEFTQSSVYKMWVKAIQRTTGQPNINAEEYQSLHIPVPPLDKQKEIANHIKDIRQQAQQLKDQTKEALKKASEEIEKILLN